MHLTLPLVALVVAVLLGTDASGTAPKWHSHYFKPTFSTAMGDIKELVHGSQDELRHLVEHVEKNVFLKDLFKHKLNIIRDWLRWFERTPYECHVDGAFVYVPNSMCYYLELLDKKTWFDAQQDCLKRGGTLAQPIFAVSDFFNFLTDDLQFGYLSRSDKDIWLGAMTNGESPNVASYQNGYILPIEDEFWVDDFPDGAGNVALHLPLSSGSSEQYKLFDPNSGTELAYMCEFMAMPKAFEVDFENSHHQALFEDYAPNEENVEHPGGKTLECQADDQFLIDYSCYKYFDQEKDILDAKHACHQDGGELASPSLKSHSHFGGALADALVDIAPADTFIWIHASAGEDAQNRDEPSQGTGTVGSGSPGSAIFHPGAPPPPSGVVLILPVSTPEDKLDDVDWFVDIITPDLLPASFTFLCEYPVADWV